MEEKNRRGEEVQANGKEKRRGGNGGGEKKNCMRKSKTGNIFQLPKLQ